MLSRMYWTCRFINVKWFTLMFIPLLSSIRTDFRCTSISVDYQANETTDKINKSIDASDETIGGLLQISCCPIDSNKNIKCMPHFIIAGTQKSGTTALSALLSEHPDINFHPKKEAHFFDRRKSFGKGIEYYLNQFYNLTTYSEERTKQLKIGNISQQITRSYRPIYAESTPFYVASRQACQRISQTLPSTKLIILLREPVSRAYSEYKMKQRRVEQQNEFIQLMQIHAAVIVNCLFKFDNSPQINFDYNNQNALLNSLQSCFPKKIAQHAHWNKFVKENFNNNIKGSNDRKKGIKRKKYVDIKSQGNYLFKKCYDLRPEQSTNNNNQNFRSISSSSFSMSDSNHAFLRSENLNNDNHNIKSVTATDMQLVQNVNILDLDDVNNVSKFYFQSVRCMGKSAQEYLVSVEVALIDEIKSFIHCATGRYNSTTLSLFSHITADLLTLPQLDKIIDRCVKVRTGITRQFIYRSIYVAQLYHCFKYIPRSRVLILSSERLQSKPIETLQSVLKFLKLKNYMIRSTSSSTGNSSVDSYDNSEQQIVWDNLNAKISKYFPHFEANTGWRLKSEYEPLDSRMQETIHQFFKPLNSMLFKYLNIQPYLEWF